MNKPLTDQEFETLKILRLEPKHIGSPQQNEVLIDRLMATIELQKSDKKLGAELVRKIQDIKHQRDALRQEVKSLKEEKQEWIEDGMPEEQMERKMLELKEENARLLRLVDIDTKEINRVDEENVKLKERLAIAERGGWK